MLTPIRGDVQPVSCMTPACIDVHLLKLHDTGNQDLVAKFRSYDKTHHNSEQAPTDIPWYMVGTHSPPGYRNTGNRLTDS